MSALAGILAERDFTVSGSDPRQSALSQDLHQRGARIFQQQSAGTIKAIRSGVSQEPLVVISSAIPQNNPELVAARDAGLEIWHRAELLAWMINAQRSIAVAGSHGKTTTSSLIASLLYAVGMDPTAVIGGVVPSFGSNARNGSSDLLVAEADESDGSLVRFRPSLGLLTNLELDHTDHYPDLEALIATMQRFAGHCTSVLANHDDLVLRQHFQPEQWWSIEPGSPAAFRAEPISLTGDGSRADYIENGQHLGELYLPMAGRHNLSNALAALAACRLVGAKFEPLQQALSQLEPPGRRFDLRGEIAGRLVVDDYAHHPSEVEATLTMAQLMVSSGRSTLPWVPRRVIAVFQPHRYSRTAEFMQRFAAALGAADHVLLAPLYAAGEAPIEGISSAAMAEFIKAGGREVKAFNQLEELADGVMNWSTPGDLVLVMGAGDVNRLWGLLEQMQTNDGIAAA